MALEKITHLTGRGVYIPGNDLDTDRIIPARYLKCVTFDGLGESLFYDVRFFEDGAPREHPLNDPRFEGATIMLADANFGCGSSREHAPQAIYRHGFRAVVAESFAEIFYGNAVTLGLVCLEAGREEIRMMVETIEQNPRTEIAIDIKNERVTFADKTLPVTIKQSAKGALMEGRWDPIAELLEAGDAVSQRAAALPYMRR